MLHAKATGISSVYEFGSGVPLPLPCLLPVGGVTLVVFPKAPHGEIAWVGFALHFDHCHVCGHTAINCPRGRKNLDLVSWETPLYTLKG